MIRRTHRPAFSIVETVFSVLLVGGVLVAAFNSAGAASVGRQHADRHARGQLLAESLMTEIFAQAYQDEDKLATLGLETGEGGANRTTFDDVDDYRNYTDSPPTLRDGTPIDGFSNWSRTVSVVRSTPSSPNTIPTSESGLKRIKVTVKCNGVLVATLVGLKTSTDPVAGKTKGILVEVLELVPKSLSIVSLE